MFFLTYILCGLGYVLDRASYIAGFYQLSGVARKLNLIVLRIAREKPAHTIPRAISTHLIGVDLFRAATMEGSQGKLSDAIPYLKLARQLIPRERFPVLFGLNECDLGIGLMSCSASGEQRLQNCRDALEAFNQAATSLDGHRYRGEWAISKHNALHTLKELGDTENSDIGYDEILISLDRTKHPSLFVVIVLEAVENVGSLPLGNGWTRRRTFLKAESLLNLLRVNGQACKELKSLPNQHLKFIRNYALLFAFNSDARYLDAGLRLLDDFRAQGSSASTYTDLRYEAIRYEIEAFQASHSEDVSALDEVIAKTADLADRAEAAGWYYRISSPARARLATLHMLRGNMTDNLTDIMRSLEMSASTAYEDDVADRPKNRESNAERRRLLSHVVDEIKSGDLSIFPSSSTRAEFQRALNELRRGESEPARRHIDAISKSPKFVEGGRIDRIYTLEGSVERGRARLLEAIMIGSPPLFQSAISDIVEDFRDASFAAAPALWTESRILIAQMLTEWNKISFSPYRYRRSIRTLKSALSQMTFRQYPLYWLKVGADLAHCESTYLFASKRARRKRLERLCADMKLICERGQVLFLKAESSAGRDVVINTLSGMGDTLCMLNLYLHRWQSAVDAVGFTRAMSVNATIDETRQPFLKLLEAREARFKYAITRDLAEQAAREQLSRPEDQWVDAISPEIFGDLAKSIDERAVTVRPSALGDQADEYQTSYLDLLNETDGMRLRQIDVNQLIEAVPEGRIVALLVTSPVGSAIIVLDEHMSDFGEDNVIWLDPDTPNCLATHINSDGGLNSSYRAWREMLANENSDDVELKSLQTEWSEALSDCMAMTGTLIMQPLFDYISAKYESNPLREVMLVAPGNLSALPLHAALVSSKNGRETCHFIERIAYSSWPSIGAVLSSVKPDVFHGFEPEGRPGVYQVVTTDTDKLNVPGDREIDPSKETVLAGLCDNQYSALYCHGFFADDAPHNSGLLLKNNEVLTAGDLKRSLFYRSQLIFLAACESGLVDTQRLPDEFVGLPVGFMQAGARSVCSTLWVAHEDATQKVVERFFQLHLQDGIRPALALRQATLELGGLHGEKDPNTTAFCGDELAHPEYWACFTLTGGF